MKFCALAVLVLLAFGEIATLNQWSVTNTPTGVVRLNRWTGEVTSCVPAQDAIDDVPGKLDCNTPTH